MGSKIGNTLEKIDSYLAIGNEKLLQQYKGKENINTSQSIRWNLIRVKKKPINSENGTNWFQYNFSFIPVVNTGIGRAVKLTVSDKSLVLKFIAIS